MLTMQFERLQKYLKMLLYLIEQTVSDLTPLYKVFRKG